MNYYNIEKSITELVSHKQAAALEEFRHLGYKFLSHLKYRVAWDAQNRETVLLSWGVGGKEHEQMRVKNQVAHEIELLMEANELVKKASLVY